MNGYLEALTVNPHGIKSLDDLLLFMESEPGEKMEDFGAARFKKAKDSPPMDFHHAFAQRLSKGSEISEILDTHECDALLLPVGCRNPGDLGQNPIMSLPMGFYSQAREVTSDKFGMTLKGPGIP